MGTGTRFKYESTASIAMFFLGRSEFEFCSKVNFDPISRGWSSYTVLPQMWSWTKEIPELARRLKKKER